MSGKGGLMEKKSFSMGDFVACVLVVGFIYWLSMNLNYVPAWLLCVSAKLLPLILGACLAFIINIPTSFIERHFFANKWGKYDTWRLRLKRPVSLLAALCFLGMLLYAFFALLLPELNATLLRLSSQIPLFVRNLSYKIQELGEKRPQLVEFARANNINIDELIEQFSLNYANLLKLAISRLSNVALDIISSTFIFVISLVFAVYIILGKEQLGRELTKLCYANFNEAKVDRFLKLMIFASKMFSRYIAATCLEASILGSLVFIAMCIFKVPYAVLVAVIVSTFALIPIFGAYISAGLGFVLILTVNYHKALLFLPLLLIIQQIEGNLIYPLVIGSQVGLPAVWVFLAVLVGGNFFGLPGLLVSVPIAAVLYVVIEKNSEKKTRSKAINPDKLKSVVAFFKVEKDVDAVIQYKPEKSIWSKRLIMPNLPRMQKDKDVNNESNQKQFEGEKEEQSKDA